MIKIDLPHNYTPNFSFFFWTKRDRWVFEYELPSNKGRITTRLTLPKRLEKKDTKKVKQLAKQKEKDLEKGILTKKEIKKKKRRTFSFSLVHTHTRGRWRQFGI